MKKSEAIEQLKGKALSLLERKPPVQRRRQACARFMGGFVVLFSCLSLEGQELLQVSASTEFVGGEDEVLIRPELFLMHLLLKLMVLRGRQRSPLTLKPLMSLLIHSSC